MDWGYKLGCGVLILASFFILRYFYNRWRLLVLEEERALYNQRLDNLTEVVTRLDTSIRNRQERANSVAVEETPPPDFEIAVKHSTLISYIDLESPPPSYEEAFIIKQLTTENFHKEQIGRGRDMEVRPSGVQSRPQRNEINLESHLTNHI